MPASPTRYQAENHVEQEPEDWYKAVCHSTRELLDGIDPGAVVGVSFSGHMMGAVLLGEDGQVLAPGIDLGGSACCGAAGCDFCTDWRRRILPDYRNEE